MRVRCAWLMLLGAGCALRSFGAQPGGTDYLLQIGNVSWIGSPGGYNCFSTTAYPNTINFTITKQVNGNRTYAVTAGPSANTGTFTRRLASGTSSLNYQVYTSSSLAQVLESPPTANPSQVLSGSSVAKAGTVIPLSFTFYIPPNQLAAPGIYSDQLTINILGSYNDLSTPQDTATVTFQAVVAPSAGLSLVPTGSAFNSSSISQLLDFGNLSKGQTKSCDLLVVKNTSCTVAFSSANKGVLKSTPTATSDSISYSCQVNGAAIDLTSTTTLTLPPGVSATQDGTRMPMTIVMGDPSNAAAGNYRDDITVTVTVQ